MEVFNQLVLDVSAHEVGDIFTVRAVNSQGVEVIITYMFIADAVLQNSCCVGDLLVVEAC
ncbi:hypothetical protein BKH36_11935 [Actinomyces naeslundii]|nr:hypothetical protein BKH36_11935 [Actinomyces naeslundii]